MSNLSSRDDMLIAAALEIVENGYAASSYAAIAARLGLTKGALVRRFPAKKDIALDIIDALRDVISDEYRRSVVAYPHSGLKSLIRFLLAVANRIDREPPVAASIVLITDRASQGVEVTQILDDWTQAIYGFLDIAQSLGEIDSETDLEELAEYIVITNLGEAIFGARAHAPNRVTPRLRFMRITLGNGGVSDIDELIDEVLESNGAGSLDVLPPRSGLPRS